MGDVNTIHSLPDLFFQLGFLAGRAELLFERLRASDDETRRREAKTFLKISRGIRALASEVDDE